MPGQNMFKVAHVSQSSRMCIFISHKSDDKPMARAVARTLVAMDYDIYFDENDNSLQAAVGRGEDEAIVDCINEGLDNSTHLLGIITPRTFNSWWVPYEIGGAKGRNKNCGHLVSSDVKMLPAYIKIAPVLLDAQALRKWISPHKWLYGDMPKEAKRISKAVQLEKYLPNSRRASTMVYF